MKTLKPLVGGCILGLCSLAFAAQAQTTTPAVPGASGTTSSSTTSPSTAGPSTTDPSATNPSGTTHSTPMNTNQTDANHAAQMKKCDAMSGAAKDACMEQAKTNRDKNKSGAMDNKTSGATSMEKQKK